MAMFGDVNLVGPPKRFLPEDSVLVYRYREGEEAEAYQSLEFVRVAAMQSSRLARWSFLIMLRDFGETEMLIGDEVFNWLAFVEVPDLFVSLGSRSQMLADRMADRRWMATDLVNDFKADRIQQIIKTLKDCGAVEQRS